MLNMRNYLELTHVEAFGTCAELKTWSVGSPPLLGTDRATALALHEEFQVQPSLKAPAQAQGTTNNLIT
jgi:hypothetical protein